MNQDGCVRVAAMIALGISAQAAERHLEVLRNAGFLIETEKGKWLTGKTSTYRVAVPTRTITNSSSNKEKP